MHGASDPSAGTKTSISAQAVFEGIPAIHDGEDVKRKTAFNNLENLQLLEEILRTGQLSAATDVLMINISTASRQLNEMREALDDPLFLRNGKGLVPTTRMQSLRPIIRSILQNVKALGTEAIFSPKTASGTFRILTYDNALLLYIFPILPILRKEAPDLFVTFGFVATSEQLVDELRRGLADLSVFPVPPQRSDILTVDLEPQRYQLLMRKDHPLASTNIEISAETLCCYTQIMPGNRPNRPWTTLRDAGVPSIAIPYFNTAPFLVESTDFVMWMPSKTAQYWLTKGTFAVRDLPTSLAYTFSPKLIWNSRSDSDPLHQWVRSLIAAHI